MDPEGWVVEYNSKRDKYELFTNKLEPLFQYLKDNEGIKGTVESRTKSVESFKRKIENRKENYTDPLKEMTDLTGVRIILSSLDDVDKVVDLIRKEFKIDKKNSTNKVDTQEPDQFGYNSMHLIVCLDGSRSSLPEWADFNGMWAEIQVRTLLQHAWAEISHLHAYKKEEDVPKKLRRKLNSISAVFELTDSNLNSLINEIKTLSKEYKEDIESKDLEIEINADSLRVYLETSENVKYWADFIKSLGICIKPIGPLDRDITMLKIANINKISEVDDLLVKSRLWGKEALKERYNIIFDKKFDIMTTATSAVVMFFLISDNLNIFTTDELKNNLFIKPEAEILPARKYNPKYKN